MAARIAGVRGGGGFAICGGCGEIQFCNLQRERERESAKKDPVMAGAAGLGDGGGEVWGGVAGLQQLAGGG